MNSIRNAIAILAIAVAVISTVGAESIMIVGGTVVDGTGAPGRLADVLIDDGVIIGVGEFEQVEADHTINAVGKVVAPGFIDMHAHGNPLRNNAFENFLAMGVTTICLGQDGSSPDREDLASWMDEVDEAQPGVNIAMLVGHATVRELAGCGLEPDLSEEQLARMAEIVDAAMEAGCFGLSTGLEYSGGRPANAEELAAVGGPVGERNGIVESHMRTEDDDAIEEALEELLEQCRASGARAHISHMKVVYGHGAERAEEILEIMQEARDSGLEVTADIYPYLASFTGIGIVFPDWALPPNDYEEVAATQRGELAEYLRNRIAQRNGPEATLIGTGQWAGMTLAEIASQEGKPFEDVLIDDLPPGSASGAYFVMDQALQDRLLIDPHVSISSDGSVTMRHPRGHGTFARILRDHVRERHLLSLEEAIHKMTGLSAETLGITDRGRLEPGLVGDVVVFDPETVQDRATFEEPHLLAEGFDAVIVNGTLVRENGEFTEARAGRVIRRR